jgi:hypothetical protein
MKALVVAAVLLLPLRAAAQDVIVERVDGYLRDKMTHQQIPGIAAAVIRDGHVVSPKATVSRTSSIRCR